MLKQHCVTEPVKCLTAQKLNIQIGALTLARDISFQLKPGQVTAILGPNGTGKSTLLKTLFGELKLDSGSIHHGQDSLDVKRLLHWRQRFGYMPQDIHLDVNLTVIEVVLLGRLDALSLRVEDHMLRAALEILQSMGLAHLANRDVRTLSGGQCQMILFAQALMREPQILMLDEPVSALDLHHQHVLLEHLVTQTREQQYITLMVLHDLNLAAQYADNLLVLKEGELVACGHPKSILTSELVQDIYNVEATVMSDENGIPFVRTLRSKKVA
ncbi:ABC transporter ATP-binding protein [Vibrio sp. ABG19]|uniref:ABC transporter ATP-binding protein n=1 Tax=Vibrio sp. ABG19 TaxID=2817385 RepID=UPI00249DA1E1|nr:ABC transporter ATP-binding protein [Vibrio sp. ABG19]WGY44868.1 ABC transporter ATP-binding protein [Vibrio sp. ABG19]